MSHYFVLVVLNRTKETEINRFIIKNEVAQLLAPYDENLVVEPYKKYLTAEDIEVLGITSDIPSAMLSEIIEDHTGWSGGKDAVGYYSLKKSNPKSKWDWWSIGGRYAGKVSPADNNNITFVRNLPEDIKCYAVVTPDGEWHAKGDMGWFGRSNNDSPDWEQTMLFTLGKYADNLVVGVDCHI